MSTKDNKLTEDKKLVAFDITFKYLSMIKKLDLIKYNRNIQKFFNNNIEDYKLASGRFIINENGKVKEYNYDGKLLFEGEYFNRKRKDI